MIRSLKLYTVNFSKSLVRKNVRSFLVQDSKRFTDSSWPLKVKSYSLSEKEVALGNAIAWLLHAQDMMDDEGFGSYHLIDGWSSSYPETSGYIIPTLYEYAKNFSKPMVGEKLIKTADWLLNIQKQSGGWQGGKIAENKPEIVFNTGQIMRGMLTAYRLTKNDKYLEATTRAADWLCKIQHPEGYWKEHALMGVPRVYDSYVDVPLLNTWEITGNNLYRDFARKNLEWIVQKKQHKNGWFEDCDNTIKRNNKPILHTIAYTIDGLLNAGLILKEEKYLNAARKPADLLLGIFENDDFLNSRYNSNWDGSEYMMSTGCAQMSGIWLMLFEYSRDRKYLDAAKKMNDFLVFVQQRNIRETQNTKGALPGSVPLWGRYESFAFPNWATKYFTDAILLELKNRKDQ